MRVLVVNAGSSSLKVRLLDASDEVLEQRDLPPPGDDDEELVAALGGLGEVEAVGHRVVHGGERFRDAVRVDDEVVEARNELTALAPLHQPGSLAGIAAARRALPGLPHVACFDTAFHATLPAAAHTYALPAAWRERWPLRRYGFHGLSHAYAARRAAALLQRDDARLVTCHLGAGASLAAVRAGTSVDTTMGFTPLEGVVMATRSGTVDPGLVLWLAERQKLRPADISKGLERESGLLGLAGTADMRELLARADDDARLAREVYLHRLRGGIGAMAAALGGLDALVFTGGVGERAAPIRAAAVDGLGFLGLGLDAARNEAAGEDADISAAGAPARTLLVHSREDAEVARQVRAALA